jgi:hypothetical protein
MPMERTTFLTDLKNNKLIGTVMMGSRGDFEGFEGGFFQKRLAIREKLIIL